MESGLFILDAIVIVVVIIMSLRDDRAGADQPSTSYFRYAEVAATPPPPRTWRGQAAPGRASHPAETRTPAVREGRGGRRSARPKAPV